MASKTVIKAQISRTERLEQHKAQLNMFIDLEEI
jgi:uncharacterized protein (UPF0335 family)